MKTCPVCNTQFDDEFFFCEHDGNKLIEAIEKPTDINIGDKNIISGDINISSNSKSDISQELDQGLGMNIGDKNIISGDINVDQTTNIGQVIINKDDTNQVVKCSASGRNIRIIESFQCKACSQVFHNEYLDSGSGKCQYCADSQKNVQIDRLKEMISFRLADLVIDQNELKELIDFSNSIGFPINKLKDLISQIKQEIIDSKGDSISDYDKEVLKLCRGYFDTFNLIELDNSIKPLYQKYKQISEIRFYYFLGRSFLDSTDFSSIKKTIIHDDLELYKADYLSEIASLNYEASSNILSKMSVSFPEHPFPKLMQFDLALQKFLSNSFTEDEFLKLENLLPSLLKIQISYNDYPFEEVLQRYFQGLYVLLFKMPMKSLFKENILDSLKQTSEFGYNRFLNQLFWKESLKDQNEIFRILNASENHNTVTKLCELPFLMALNKFRLGALKSVTNTDDFKFNVLDPKIKERYEKEFINSSKHLPVERTVPFTDIFVDQAGGISVPVSMKFKAELIVEDLSKFSDFIGGNNKLNIGQISKFLEKEICDLMLSDFGTIMNRMDATIDRMSALTSKFEETFMEMNCEMILEKWGVRIGQFMVIRLTPDKESNGYSKAINSSKPPILSSSNNFYHINVNNINYGPYSLQQLSNMIPTGQFTNETMVWCEGMSQWDYAANISELNQLF